MAREQPGVSVVAAARSRTHDECNLGVPIESGDGIGAGGKVHNHRHQQNYGRPSGDHPTPIAFVA
jgi:hypothetical protein